VLPYFCRWLKIVLGVGILFVWLQTPALAASERVPLTLSLLQERIDAPVLSEGVITIDLRQFKIDLTNENAIFQEQFYQLLHAQLARSQQPIGIDFSQSAIAGDLLISKLGLLTPLSQASLPPLFTPIEQEEIKRDKRFLLEPGEQITSVIVFRGPLILNDAICTGKVDLAKTIFLQRVEAINSIFTQEADWSQTRFNRKIDFSGATFRQKVNLIDSTFLGAVKFRQARFLANTNFTNSEFQSDVSFERAEFSQVGNFTQIQALKSVDFSQVNWRDRILFSESYFAESLSFYNATFEKSVVFRTSRFLKIIDFQDVKLLEQVDFSNALFFPKSYINVAGLAFDSDRAKILGDTGVIGRFIALNQLAENETVVRNLVRNFRNLEQIPDANQIEYKSQKLRIQQLSDRIWKIPLKEVFHLTWFGNIINWLFLNFLILLSDYGTNFNLVLGVGIVAIAYFGFLFWFVDRWRRRIPTPILPNRYDTICMSISAVFLTLVGLTNIFEASEQPAIALACLGLLLFPLPLGLLWQLYRKGRYHDLIESSYFVEDGSMRQLRLLIVRLPVIPDFPFFRDRYMPLPWQRRWNWLNYYDLSLNNFFKLGFNDIRLRDIHLPGIISTLVWYQWSLGILYIALLLWTVSRTIPGLNLLIYLK
jgi:uncharacterized protein YjbI with pentapeptide repeats